MPHLDEREQQFKKNFNATKLNAYSVTHSNRKNYFTYY